MKRQRVPRACEACRRKKIRCILFPGGSSCVKCQEINEKCVPHVPIVRGERSKRVLETLSERVEQLQRTVALHEKDSSSFEYQDYSPKHEIVSVDTHNCAPSSVLDDESHGNHLARQLVDELELGTSCPILTSMSTQQLGHLLRLYDETASSTLMAIRLTEGQISLDIAERPILVLAAVVVASTSEPILQQELDQAFRRTLAEQVIVQGQQSMDLLQAILTYILWYHHCFDPRTQQVYQYIELAKAMANDLDINGSTFNPTNVKHHDDIVRARMLLFYLERGCVMLGFRRQKLLEDEVVVSMNCGNSIENDLEMSQLIYLLNGAVIAVSTINDSFENLHSNFKKCLLDVQNWRPRVTDCAAMVITGWFAKVQLFLKLHCCKKSSTDVERWSDNLELCSKSAISLIEYVLSELPSILGTMTLVEWAHFLTTLLLLPCFDSICVPSSQTITISTVNAIRISLAAISEGSTRKPHRLFYWLELILSDIESMALHHIPIPRLSDVFLTSPYELLESLTKRQTGINKEVLLKSHSTRIPANKGPKAVNLETPDILWQSILTDWLDLSGDQ